ncbi:type II secretion system protein [Sporosarcina sp. CAU 1771]
MNSKGLTLIEVLAVVVILSILVSIGSITVNQIIKNSKETICYVNRDSLEKSYETEIALTGKEHSDIDFNRFLDDFDGIICPLDGTITYLNEEVHCSIHKELEEDDEDEVPYL